MLNVTKPHIFLHGMSRQSIVKWHCTVCTMLPSPTKINKTAGRDGRRDRCCVQRANVVSWQLRKIQDWKIFDEEVINSIIECIGCVLQYRYSGASARRSGAWPGPAVCILNNQPDNCDDKPIAWHGAAPHHNITPSRHSVSRGRRVMVMVRQTSQSPYSREQQDRKH